MANLPIAGGSKFVPTSEPGERIPVNTIPKPHEIPNNQWDSDAGLAGNEDTRPPQARPAEGQETSGGWNGFAKPEKFSNQGSTPYKFKK